MDNKHCTVKIAQLPAAFNDNIENSSIGYYSFDAPLFNANGIKLNTAEWRILNIMPGAEKMVVAQNDKCQMVLI